MGQIGVTPFGNDRGLDFVWEIQEEGVEKIVNTLRSVAAWSGDDLLNSDWPEALVAIEFIAAAKGKPAEDITEEVEAWIEENDTDELLSPEVSGLSQKIIYRLKSEPGFNEIWIKPGAYEKWLEMLTDLSNRSK